MPYKPYSVSQQQQQLLPPEIEPIGMTALSILP